MIYALVDPRTNEWRYIGKSCEGLYRPRKHKGIALKGRRSHLYNWIRGLLSIGTEYIIDVVEESSNAEAVAEAEKEWIAAARGIGVALTNATDGGEGAPGYKHTSEAMAKMRAKRMSEANKQRMRDRIISEETRIKMSAAAKSRKTKPDPTRARTVLDSSAAAKRLWASISGEERRKKMDYARSRFDGHTEEHKAAVSEASKRRWAEWKATGRDREIGRNISEGLRKKRAAQ